MSMSQQTWYGAAAGYLGMWMAMMVPMMLPSLIPMLSRYRGAVRGAGGVHRHGLTALVGVSYFAVWAALGAVAYVGGAGLRAIEMRWDTVERWLPIATGSWRAGATGQGALTGPRPTPWVRGGTACGWACNAASAAAA
jgi:predicted metal-binding membrane protein